MERTNKIIELNRERLSTLVQGRDWLLICQLLEATADDFSCLKNIDKDAVNFSEEAMGRKLYSEHIEKLIDKLKKLEQKPLVKHKNLIR